MQNAKILVVDDETVISMQLEDHLRSIGYDDVWRASSGEDMISKARSIMPDLILSDIVMPGKLDGIEAAGRVKRELGIPVIFLTAYGDEGLIERAKNVNPLGYLIKPFNLKEIEATVKIALNTIAKGQQQKQEKEDLKAINEYLDELLTGSMVKLTRKEGELQAEIAVHEQTAEQAKALLKEKEMLLKEVHHRVRNNLQIVASLLNLQVENIKDKKTLDMFKKSQNRIKSMALVYEKSYQSKEPVRIDFAEYTQNLTNSLLRSYEINQDRISVKINMGDILLDINNAIPCGLIINELVSNSLIYAFPFAQGKPENKKGEININLSSGDDSLTLIVRDNGIGFPEDLDFRNTETLGMQLVCTLTNQLKGTIELNSNGGTSFKITFKV